MKKYFIHNGEQQDGPFDIEELQSRKILKDTPIWYEGLTEWTTADKIDELNDLFKTTIPPPFETKNTSPPINKANPEQAGKQISSKKKSKSRRKIISLVLGGLIGIVLVIVIIDHYLAQNNSNSYSYEEKVMTIEEMERSKPTNFLSAEGNYNLNFWGDKIKVHGIINNTATVANYKDAIVRVVYYSKTQTNLGSKDYTIYESFTPYSKVNFELVIDNYQDVNSIGLEVVDAKAF